MDRADLRSPIPGTRRCERLDENAGATGVALSADEVVDPDTDTVRLGDRGDRRHTSHTALVERRPTLPPRDRAPPCDPVPGSRAVAFAGRPVSSATPTGRHQATATRRVVKPMTAATAARAATLVSAVGRENQSAMNPMAGGPRSMPP